MNVLIIGSNGSMGRRYQAILKYLGKSFTCLDQEHTEDMVLAFSQDADAIIIATPTDTHAYYIHLLSPVVKVPILCEKPITKDIDELKGIIDVCRANKTNLTMMMQYKFLDFSQMLGMEGPSFYDYFKTGNDGLYWDCFQTIALARGSVVVRNDSPTWECQLNGRKINFTDMDHAYVSFVSEWLQNPGDDLNQLFDMHVKVKKHEVDYGPAQ